MNTALTEALKEAYAVCRTDVAFLETIQIYNAVAGYKYLVQDLQDRDFTIEGGAVRTFQACGFRMSLPQSGDNGLQELTLAIDNINLEASDYINLAKESNSPVIVTYRPYLSTDFTTPQMNPPLVLYLTDVVVTVFEVSGKATFADIINKKFPTDIYTRARFPSLAN